MSHYTVLVIGEDPERQLAPFHEFECTGIDDEYVQEIDRTEDARTEFESDTTTRYRDTDGNLHSPYTEDGEYDIRFWRVPTPEEVTKCGPLFGSGCGEGIKYASRDWQDGRGYAPRVFQLPEGWTEVEVPTKDTKTFSQFCEDWFGHRIVPFGTQPDKSETHKYGFTIIDENGEVVRTVDRTNPNKKWDWYKMGGRWNGFFKLKAGRCAVIGEPGSNKLDPEYEEPSVDRADQCMKADIDVEGMRHEAAKKAADRYDLFAAATEGMPPAMTWQQVVDKNNKDYDAARTEYNDQPAVKALKENKETVWFEYDDFVGGRTKYIERARKSAISTFAVVKDGQWYEKGEMGWWGIVHDEKDEDVWLQQFSSLIDSLPENTLLTIVDCHI
jgi:hypothetical protein